MTLLVLKQAFKNCFTYMDAPDPDTAMSNSVDKATQDTALS
jgi:hypothetical protein